MALALKKDDEADDAEQGYLPDMSPEKNVKVHGLAKKFYKQTRELKALKKALDETRDTLLWNMSEESLTHYYYGDIIVDVTDKRAIKVKFASAKDKPKKARKKKAKAE